MQIDYVLTGWDKFDRVIRCLHYSRPGRLVPKGQELTGDLAVIMSMHPGVEEMQIKCRQDKRRYVYIDHAYFCRGHERGNYRVTVGDIYKSTMEARPDDRLQMWGVQMRPWRESGDHILAIHPSGNVARVLGGEGWLEENAERLGSETGRKVIYKNKGNGSIFDALSGAWAFVSFASNADVDAVLFGVPGLVSSHSPAYSLNSDLTNLPDRRPWARSLAYAQFSMAEMRDGLVWRTLGL